MKRLTLTALLSLLLLPMMAQQVTETYRIKQMRCDHCAHKVMVAMTKDDTVDDIQFNLERRTATITYDKQKADFNALQATLAGTKYSLSAYDPAEVIMCGKGLRIDDMHCQNCANRIQKVLGAMQGVDYN